MWDALLGLGLSALKSGSSRSQRDMAAVNAGAAACAARVEELGRTVKRLQQQRAVAVVAAFAAGLGGLALGFKLGSRR